MISMAKCILILIVTEDLRVHSNVAAVDVNLNGVVKQRENYILPMQVTAAATGYLPRHPH